MLPAGARAARRMRPRSRHSAHPSIRRSVCTIPHAQITWSATAGSHPMLGAVRITALTVRTGV